MRPASGAGSPLAGKPTLTYRYVRPPDRVSTFTADLIRCDERLIVMTLTLDRSEPLYFRGEEVVGEGYRAVWFLHKGEGWDIAAVYRADGAFTGYYVDVLEPVQWIGADPGTLRPVVDLFLDLWIAPDGSYDVLDEDEFAEAVEKGWIGLEQRQHAEQVLVELKESLRDGSFPPPEVRDIAASQTL